MKIVILLCSRVGEERGREGKEEEEGKGGREETQLCGAEEG